MAALTPSPKYYWRQWLDSISKLLCIWNVFPIRLASFFSSYNDLAVFLRSVGSAENDRGSRPGASHTKEQGSIRISDAQPTGSLEHPSEQWSSLHQQLPWTEVASPGKVLKVILSLRMLWLTPSGPRKIFEPAARVTLNYPFNCSKNTIRNNRAAQSNPCRAHPCLIPAWPQVGNLWRSSWKIECLPCFSNQLCSLFSSQDSHF